MLRTIEIEIRRFVFVQWRVLLNKSVRSRLFSRHAPAFSENFGWRAIATETRLDSTHSSNVSVPSSSISISRPIRGTLAPRNLSAFLRCRLCTHQLRFLASVRLGGSCSTCRVSFCPIRGPVVATLKAPANTNDRRLANVACRRGKAGFRPERNRRSEKSLAFCYDTDATRLRV